eukprot:5197277-Pleurochrysis_carterae.AAC.1
MKSSHPHAKSSRLLPLNTRDDCTHERTHVSRTQPPTSVGQTHTTSTLSRPHFSAALPAQPREPIAPDTMAIQANPPRTQTCASLPYARSISSPPQPGSQPLPSPRA